MSIEITCANHLIAHWSRYGRYWQLLMLFYYSFAQNKGFEDKLNKFADELQKTLVVYSIVFDKSVNEMHIFLRDLVDVIINDKHFEKLISQLKTKRNERQNNFINTINGEIFHNAKKKNLICRTSALIDEIKCNMYQQPEKLGRKIFMSPIDIEHIHSRGDISNSKEKLDLWGFEMNSLGNLTILESGLNKSVSNKSFHKKIPEYDQRSNYEIVRNLVRLSKGINEWTVDMAITRKETEIEKLRKYYFD